MSTAHQLYSSQFQWDNATPPEDPPEPDFDGEIGDLMDGEDTHLVLADDFKESAEEALFEMDIRPLDVINLILAACSSRDMAMCAMAKRLKPALEKHAEQMLLAAHEKAIKEKRDEH